MRFTLRNKEKIIKAHGKDYYDLLTSSLKSYFGKTDTITEYDYARLKYKIIHVPSIFKNSEIDFEFAVLSKTFNVYNLAYYSAIG